MNLTLLFCFSKKMQNVILTSLSLLVPSIPASVATTCSPNLTIDQPTIYETLQIMLESLQTQGCSFSGLPSIKMEKGFRNAVAEPHIRFGILRKPLRYKHGGHSNMNLQASKRQSWHTRPRAVGADIWSLL